MRPRGITLAALLGVAWAPLAGAQPPATPAPAKATAPAPNSEESRITRMIKSAEREGFEHHELERALAIYAPDAALIIGRRAVPDAHDVTLDLAAQRAVLTRRYRVSPSKQQQVFFRDVVVQIEGDTATLTAVVTREHHTGRDELKARYRLARRGGAWKVTERRTWPLMRAYGGLPTIYSDEAWLAAEKQVETTLANPDSTRQARLSALTQAGFLKRAHDETQAWTVAEPKNPEAWRARLRFALEVGDVADVEAAEKGLAALGEGKR